MELESLKGSRKIKHHLEVDRKLESRMLEVNIPPLLIQPILENSFKHAFNDEIGRPYVKLSFSYAGSKIKVCVEDNGIGFVDFGNKKLRSTSTGLKTVRERLELNAKQLQVNNDSAFLQVETKKEDGVPGKKTIVTLIIDISNEQ